MNIRGGRISWRRRVNRLRIGVPFLIVGILGIIWLAEGAYGQAGAASQRQRILEEPFR